MCGITGVVSFSGAGQENSIQKIVRMLRHRGLLFPYLQEYVLNPNVMEPLNMEAIRRALEEFLRGKNHHSYRMWLLLIYGV